MLSRDQQTTLIQIARDSISARLEGQRSRHADGRQFDETLRRPAGAFVTLTLDGHLRGCIGSVHPVDPLWRAVAVSAVNAAFHDPRFHPLTPEEFTATAIEISVMGPIVPVKTPEEIVPGRDGLIIRRGSAAGLLLPQVATEYRWDVETFLRQTCTKAGLDSGAWRLPGTSIERFSAEVFGE
jgi:AmmeMemoRadiSam system protein A